MWRPPDWRKKDPGLIKALISIGKPVEYAAPDDIYSAGIEVGADIMLLEVLAILVSIGSPEGLIPKLQEIIAVSQQDEHYNKLRRK